MGATETLTKKLTRYFIYFLAAITAVTTLYLAGILALSAFGVLFIAADVSGAPNASLSGADISSIIATIFTGIIQPHLALIGLFILYAGALGLAYWLYKKQKNAAAFLITLASLIVSIPLAHPEVNLLLDGGSIPDGADPISFHYLSYFFPQYAVDAQHAYCGSKLLPGADPQTLQLVSYQGEQYSTHYAKDANNVYDDCIPISGADPATFQAVPVQSCSDFPGCQYDAMDKNDRYTDGTSISSIVTQRHLSGLTN